VNKIILAPVYNDSQNALKLVKQITLDYPQFFNEIILVDDGSDNTLQESFISSAENFLEQKVKIIRLTSNQGHQRAIAIGLCYIRDNFDTSDVVVLDSDGEDGSSQIQSMLDIFANDANVVATRSKRQENFLFRQGYWCFKFLFYLLTGKNLNFGNFTLINFQTVNILVNNANLWNNYPATLLRFIPKITRIRLPRQKRFSGQSSMNLVSFVQHGLGAISVFLDQVLIRILFALFIVFSSLSIFMIVGFVLYLTSILDLTLLHLGFAGLAFLTVLNICILALFSLIIFLANRSTKQEPPILFYKSLISHVKLLGKN